MASTADILFLADRHKAEVSGWVRRNPVSAAGAVGFAALVAGFCVFGLPSGSGEAVANAPATTGVAPTARAAECDEQVWPNFSRSCVKRAEARTRPVRVIAIDRDSPRVLTADRIPQPALAEAKAMAHAENAAIPSPPRKKAAIVQPAGSPAKTARSDHAGTPRLTQSDGREVTVPSHDGTGSRRIVVRQADRYERYNRFGRDRLGF